MAVFSKLSFPFRMEHQLETQDGDLSCLAKNICLFPTVPVSVLFFSLTRRSSFCRFCDKLDLEINWLTALGQGSLIQKYAGYINVESTTVNGSPRSQLCVLPSLTKIMTVPLHHKKVVAQILQQKHLAGS